MISVQFGVKARATSPVARKLAAQAEERAARAESERREREAAEVQKIATVDLLRSYHVRPIIPVPDTIPGTSKDIIREIARKYALYPSDITGPCRRKYASAARHEAAYRMRTELGMSYPQIGNRLGGRDHTSALYGAHKHAYVHGLKIDGTHATLDARQARRQQREAA